MSDKERPKIDSDCSGGGGGGDDDDDDKKCKGCGGKKGKRLSSFFRSRKGKKLKDQRRKQKGVSVNPGCWGKRVVGGGVCLKKPRNSAGESPSSDPNSPEFTFDMLRTFIEKNDFYSKESNPHLDLDCLD